LRSRWLLLIPPTFMPEERFRVLAIASHPVQYMAPLFRLMAKQPALNLQVAYCSLRGAATAGYDPDFQAAVQWDVPLLDGYPWVELPNKGSGNQSFWGLRNPGLRELIRTGQFDAVLCYVGYRSASFWIARRAAFSANAAFLFGTDAHTLVPRDPKGWKVRAKKLLWPVLFRQADQIFVPSTGTFELMRSLGVAAERITLTPYAVDNEWWKAQSAQVDRNAVRAGWGARSNEPVILFCAKLQTWKRPLDLLLAFQQAALPQALLVYAGDGPLRKQLEEQAARLQIQNRVKFLGFVNQSQLPALYTAADVMVLPSDYEPFAVVVNEAMCCRCPAIVSDQVGAGRDLIAPLRPEFVFPTGDVAALAMTLQVAFADRQKLRETAVRAYQHIETHSPQKTVAATVEAVAAGVARVRRRSQPA
jgi:glycosyltransferase involved in cell wall biosynthesis